MRKLITKKDTLKQSIPLIAMMCAFSAIMIAFVTYLPVSTIVFTFLIPLPSIIVALYTKSKYYFIYFISCFALSLLVGAGDIGYAISQILPSLIVSLVIGILIKKDFSIYFTFLISSITLLILNVASICIMNYLFNINIVQLIKDLLNINVDTNLSFLTLSLIYVYSLIQTFLILLVSLDQIKFLLNDLKTKKSPCLIEIICSLIFTITSGILFIFSYDFAYLFLIISLISCMYLIPFEAKTMLKCIIFGIIVVFTWILYIALLPSLGTKNSFSILLLIPTLVAIFALSFSTVKLVKSRKTI